MIDRGSMPRKRMVLNTDVYPILGKIETAGSTRVDRWKTWVVQQLKDKIEDKVSQYSLKLDFYINEDRIWKVDIDNLAEPVLNAIKEAGIYYEDSHVYNVEKFLIGYAQRDVRPTSGGRGHSR